MQLTSPEKSIFKVLRTTGFLKKNQNEFCKLVRLAQLEKQWTSNPEAWVWIQLLSINFRMRTEFVIISSNKPDVCKTLKINLVD